MKLRGIEFGPIMLASGTRGFFGEGYNYQKLLGIDYTGTTFVAKTMTLHPRQGNMPQQAKAEPNVVYRIRSLKPRCIKVNLMKAVAANAVGLTNKGTKALCEDGRWQQRKLPFFLSFMAMEQTPAKRKEETKEWVKIFQGYLSEFQAPVGLEMNYSCPNIGLHIDELIDEVTEGLTIASALNIPLVPKFNVNIPVEVARKISEHPRCDAICMSNTIPWGQSDEIAWNSLFLYSMVFRKSPLWRLGGGGLSGKYLLPLVVRWVRSAREAGIKKPVSAGGGILEANDVDRLKQAGASAVFIGSASFLRWWQIRPIIQRAHNIF